MCLLTRNVLCNTIVFVCTSPSEVLLGVSPHLSIFAPERVVARSFSTLGLYVSLSELLLGVVAPHSGCVSVCIYVCLSELLLGVVAPRSGTNKTCVCGVVHVVYCPLAYTRFDKCLMHVKVHIKRYWIVHVLLRCVY